MRCPSCGTDNAPDSRFCGGCGTRFAVSGQRVAPTQKITDDTSFPQRPLAPGAGSAVPVTAPGVVAPRAIPATPFQPSAAAAVQRPLAGGSAAPARPPTAQPLARAPRRPDRSAPAPARSPSTPPLSSPSPRPQALVVDAPSRSLPIAARRRWTLIAIVLLIDLGLAAAGVWMLVQGLGDRGRSAPRSGELTSPLRGAS
ncbi:MAG TPA: zinc-ribbon domain-containing protein [Kofleriaceae bacterium]|nr:zinc-ribbon domain-containing protein [Kofleriaceae bacterium]